MNNSWQKLDYSFLFITQFRTIMLNMLDVTHKQIKYQLSHQRYGPELKNFPMIKIGSSLLTTKNRHTSQVEYLD